MQRYRAQVS